ncbi:MAG: hypothetical protein IH917_03935 [Acidobacteria bacterium]|nr:hypothetical protein [Acidobacteriota bacterium]
MKGTAEVFPEQGKSFDPGGIPRVIEEAGFSVTEIILSVDGTLVQGQEFLKLEVPGLESPFLLVGGEAAERLSRGVDLVATEVRVTGTLRPGDSGQPPRLTIEEFQAPP